MKRSNFFRLVVCLIATVGAIAGDRVITVDLSHIHELPGTVHPLAKPQFDRGPADPAMRMEDMMLIVKPSTAQQKQLNQLLADQQNPASPQFQRWLTPEVFGAQFGLSAGDHAKVMAWLSSQGFDIKDSGRARNWIRFSGSAGQVGNALHTQIHRYEVNGEKHFANRTPLAVPEALADVVAGFTGLHDFNARPQSTTVAPDFTSGTNHFLVPADFDTIYDVNPVAAAGIDGTGVKIGIVGTSQIQLSDIRAFRTKYTLPANDPIMVLVGADPGLASSQREGDLDVEWSGAIAPGATVYFYYSTSLQNSIAAAINANQVQIISISFGSPEIGTETLAFQPIMQQANTQGITILTGAGDSGAASAQDPGPFFVFGPSVKWPATYPEVTALGGTQFDDTANPGAYWAPTNDANSSSALSYIPEIAWSQSGGGVSAVFSKPDWQTGNGVPQDGMRDIPDLALNASTHDAHEVISNGSTVAVGGNSCNGPAMAGIIALLTQYLVSSGQISNPGLGNINPQLYRMAQSVPNAFHDIVSGSNTVPCLIGTTGCLNGAFGYQAGPGYDLVTGIGTLDVNNFITQWSSYTNGVSVTLSASPASGTLNDTFQISAMVTPASGMGTPTGMVDFTNGGVALGSAALDATSSQAIANLSVPGYLFLNPGSYSLYARYRGDAAFNTGGATANIQLAAPAGASSIVPVVPVSVTATKDPAGLLWRFSITLREYGGVAAVLTGVNLDGQDQTVSDFFASTSIPAGGSITSGKIVFRDLTYPLTRTFIFSGNDANGQSWSRQASITFLGMQISEQTPHVTAIPSVVPQDPTAAANCQWSQELVVTEFSGFPDEISSLLGNAPSTVPIAEIFGTTVLAPYGFLQGSICWPAATAGESSLLTLNFASGLSQTLPVSFAAPLANPSSVSVSPTAFNLSTANPQAALTITAPDDVAWTIGANPQNITSGWLSLSQSAGTGSAQIVVTASGSSLAQGAYLANLVIQGPNLWPPSVTIPVTFANGPSTGVTISSLSNAASGQLAAAPGMLAVLQGTNLFRGGFNRMNAFGPVYGYGTNVANLLTLTVNGIPAALNNVTSTQIKFQIPYEIGAGTAVLGINYGGTVTSYVFQISPSAPGIFADSTGSLGTVQAGKSISLSITGDGITDPLIGDATQGTGSLLYKTALPITVTIGGVPASVTSYGIPANSYSTMLNVVVPPSVPAGPQPIVVAVGGVSSRPANLMVTAAP